MNDLIRTKIAQAVTHAFNGYETALNANDVETLQSYFHQSPEAIRFGVNEQLYGFESIAAFRKGRVINFHNRTKIRFEVSVLSETVATTMYEYSLDIDGRKRRGRQSQTWLCKNGSWKIMTAHVSLLPEPAPSADWASYAQQASAALDFTISPAHITGVVQQLETMDRLSSPLMNFDLPETVEPAPVFRS